MSVESRITIDRDRNMIVPEELRKRIIQYDHNIETIGIDCPRYWDGRDLSKMKILVNYVVNKSTGICSSYLVGDVTVDNTGDKETDMMHFDWIVREDATQKDGLLPLFVCAQVIDELGNTENHWSSRLNEEIDIGKSYKCLQNIVDIYPSIIGQILADIDKLKENGGSVTFTYNEATGDVTFGNETVIAAPEGIEAHTEVTSINGRGLQDAVAREKISELSEEIEDLEQNGTGTDIPEEQVNTAVKEWLDKHPEATTTVQDGAITYEKLADDVKETIDKASKSGSAIQSDLAKTINFGNIIPVEEKEGDYLCWTMGNCKYDKYTDKVVFLYNAREEHVASLSRIYMRTIDCQTYEVSKSTLVADTVDIGGTEYALVSNFFLILEDGTYLVLAKASSESNTNDVVANYVYKSTDHGATWTQTEISINTSHTYNGNHNPVVLSNGRIIATITTSGLQHVMYSDDNGENWTIASMVSSSGLSEGFIVELDDVGNLCCISRQSASVYTTKKPAKLSFSSDYGATWTAPVGSVSIPDMTANPCSAIVDKDGMVTLFYGSRYNGNGHNATLYKQNGTLEQLTNDNMNEPVVVCHGDAVHGQDFGYVACCEDKYGQMYVVYYDGDSTEEGYTTIKLVRASRTNIDTAINDSVAGKTNVYSAEMVERLLKNQYDILIKKINDIILENGGNVDDEGDGSYPVMSGLIHWLKPEDVESTTWTDFIDNTKSYAVTEYNSEMNLVKTNGSINFGTSGDVGIDTDYTFEFDVYNVATGQLLLYSKNGVQLDMDIQVKQDQYYINGTSYTYNSWGSGNAGELKEKLIHFALTKDADGNYNIYINGKLEGSTTDATVLDSTRQWAIGRESAYLGNVRIYNRALTSDEVANNYKYEQSIYTFATVN